MTLNRSKSDGGAADQHEHDRQSSFSRAGRLLSAVAWLVPLSLVAIALLLGWQAVRTNGGPGASRVAQAAQPENGAQANEPTATPVHLTAGDLPAFQPLQFDAAIRRAANLHTTIPSRPRQDVQKYTVDTGDSVFEIAQKFNLTPETVLWANYDLLNDNPDLISLDMELNIPPVNGVYYQWQEGDTVDAVAGRFQTEPSAILNWSGNHLDLTDPQVEPGAWIMVPDGKREFRQWLIPVIPRGRAGVSKSVYGAGACEDGYDGALGTGGFVWPAGNHVLSGNDYWDGHLGIDIAAGEGAQIYAADSGVVVFAGWALGGYGNMVMIDHGNGYQTVYAHMSSIATSCGRSVSQGGLIGYAGSTGNSTGPHLHFEVRYQGGFISPWYVLP